MANIRDLIKELASVWINPEFSKRFDASYLVKELIVHAFVNQIPEGFETRLLRESYLRLYAGDLSGDYDVND